MMSKDFSWMTWMTSHFGEPFKTGLPPTEFNRMVFSHTDCPLDDEMLPGCAATVCAALELSGYKSTHDASAISFAEYGNECKPFRGAIIVLEHLSGPLKGHYHVGFFVNIDDRTITLLGGNQDHQLCVKSFPLREYKIAASRWPVMEVK